MNEHRLLVLAPLFNLLGLTCDMLTSRRFPAGFAESNPFSRDLLYGFVPWHAAAYEAAWFAVILVMGLVLYFGLQRFSELVAQVAFSALFMRNGLSSFTAAIHNLWLKLGWYIG